MRINDLCAIGSENIVDKSQMVAYTFGTDEEASK